MRFPCTVAPASVEHMLAGRLRFASPRFLAIRVGIMRTHRTTGRRVVSAAVLFALALLECEAAALPGHCAGRAARPSGAPEWVLVGNAADRDGFFELTPNEFNQRGALWQSEPVDLRESF